MMLNKGVVSVSIGLVFALFAGVYGQNTFEGYSVVVEANAAGACPVSYLPSAGNGNAVDVFVAGTNQKTPANITPCDDSTLKNGNNLIPNGNGQWCFNGPEKFYDVKFQNGATYLWYPVTSDTGFYNVKDFRPVTRTSGPQSQYLFNDPPDWTNTIRNAIAFIAARQGGTLRFPDGDYVVGTLDGNRRDPKFEAITLPSGIVIEGASSNISVPTANHPIKKSATRIRLRHPNQSIFRIGGCTFQVVVRQIELLGNSALFGEANRDSTGNYGIEGMGHIFTNSRDELFQNLAECVRLIKRDGSIWVSWYKKAAKLPTEIIEDTVREAAFPLGLVDIKVCAVDEKWSGLKLVIRKENRI